MPSVSYSSNHCSPKLFADSPSPGADTDGRGSCCGCAPCPILHSWNRGAQHPVDTWASPWAQAPLVWTPFSPSLLSTHRSDTDPLVQAFPLLGCSYRTKGAKMCFFPLWPPLVINSYSSHFCATFSCTSSHPAVWVCFILLVNSSQSFYVTCSP